MTYVLPEDARRALIEYLANRPWREVANLMPALLTAKPLPVAGEGVAGVEGAAAPEKE